jgi:mono/diheme cytochrome c family protein
VGAAATDGRSLYVQNCASCHGQTLQGGIGPALKRRNWPYGQDRDLLIKIIHQGKGLSMPAFDGRLNNQQIEAIADYMDRENNAN